MQHNLGDQNGMAIRGKLHGRVDQYLVLGYFFLCIPEIGIFSGRHRDGSLGRAEYLDMKLWSGNPLYFVKLDASPVLR